VAAGTPEEVAEIEASATGQFLSSVLSDGSQGSSAAKAG
jgi:excinuclease UvrABC ATPase subunit